jgi:hypothetical protein
VEDATASGSSLSVARLGQDVLLAIQSVMSADVVEGRPQNDPLMLNAVLVMVLTTSILGPLLTQHFATRLRAEASAAAD